MCLIFSKDALALQQIRHLGPDPRSLAEKEEKKCEHCQGTLSVRNLEIPHQACLYGCQVRQGKAKTVEKETVDIDFEIQSSESKTY